MKHTKLNKTGINLLFINSLIYITLSLYTPYLTSYYSKSGMNALEIGILVTIGPLAAIFIQPLWAVLSDRTGKKKYILVLVILGSALSIYSYYISKTFLTFLVASFLLAIFSTSIIPLSDAITLHSAHKHNFDFSQIRLGGTIGYAIFAIISGEIVKRNPDLQFFMGSIGYLLLLIAVLILPKNDCISEYHTDMPVLPKRSLKERLNLINIFGSKQIFFLLAFAFISQVGLSFNYTFLGVYMVKQGFSEGIIGLISSVCAFSEIPVLFLINRILKKSSAMKITVIACFILGLRILSVTGESIFFLVLSQLMHGLTFMVIYYSCAVFISKNVKPGNQSQGQSILAIVQAGIGSIVGNILGGCLVDAYGLKSAYITMAILVVSTSAVIFILLILFKRSDKSKT